MWESYGSWPRDAMQEGHRHSLGAYYSCLEVGDGDDKGEWETPEKAPFSSQYCHVSAVLCCASGHCCLLYTIVLFPRSQISAYYLPKNASVILSSLDASLEDDEARGAFKPLLPPGSELLLSLLNLYEGSLLLQVRCALIPALVFA